MAFVTPAPTALRSSKTTARSARTSRRRIPVAVASSSSSSNPSSRPASTPAARPSPSPSPSAPPSSAPRPRARAPVVDSRVASVLESHHWIVVKNEGRRLFERAAVAQADMTRQVERRAGQGALHRWVLREVADPTGGMLHTTVRGVDAKYVVMETFKARVSREKPGIMRRWLSAVERVGPALNAVDIRTRNYENVFTSKLHDVEFDPNQNVVVVESVNVDMSRSQNLPEVVDILRSTAEANVAAGNCLEFCVLHKPGEQGFFKTIEVYKDVDALRDHLDSLDMVYARRVQGRTTDGHRSRQTFHPVVFA